MIFLINTLVISLFMSLGYLGDVRIFWKLTVTVLRLEERAGGFCDVGYCCCCFPHLGLLRVQVIFPYHRHSTLASQACECLHQL